MKVGDFREKMKEMDDDTDLMLALPEDQGYRYLPADYVEFVNVGTVYGWAIFS